jgi:hypothetical protein
MAKRQCETSEIPFAGKTSSSARSDRSAPEKVVSAAVVAKDGTPVVHSGKRFTNLKGADLENYIGKRAQRGLKLPRGFQNASSIRNERESRGGGPSW